jgi:hypothetical protein
MADHLFDIGFTYTRQRDQAVLHAQEVFPNDVQVMPQEQIIILVDAPCQGILDRN